MHEIVARRVEAGTEATARYASAFACRINIDERFEAGTEAA